MRVILHDSVTDLYFIAPNMWTNDRAKAHDFERVEPAVEVAKRTGLKDVELVLSYTTVPGDLRLPVGHVTAWPLSEAGF